MVKFVAQLAFFAILGLFAVEASIHRTIVTTEIEEIDATGQQSQKCHQQIQSQDLRSCEYFITQMGPRAAFNMEQRPQCCQQLQKMDQECRCEALMAIVRQQQQSGQMQGEEMQGEEMQEMMKRARSIPTYCRMASCQWTEVDATMMIGDEQGCRQQVQRQDMNKCARFIRQQRGGHGIIMTTSNPMTEEVQGCCQQLSQVDKQCRCEALKEVVRKQQQHGRVEEMEEMMQIAERIPKMCNMEPRTCQWRIVLY